MKQLKNLAVVVVTVCSFFTQVVAWSKNTLTPAQIKEGIRLPSKDQLREVFPESTRVEEYTYLPKQWGGISLMGLIGRLTGDRANSEYEGIDTKRYLYRAFRDAEVLGIAHGSSTELHSSNPFDVFVFYDPASKIKDIRLQRLPDDLVGKLTQGGYMQQFVDRETADFSVRIGKRGRVKDWGEFARNQKRPSEGGLRPVWEKIVRAVRFNAAFVEVAYFISQHPIDATDKSASLR